MRIMNQTTAPKKYQHLTSLWNYKVGGLQVKTLMVADNSDERGSVTVWLEERQRDFALNPEYVVRIGIDNADDPTQLEPGEVSFSRWNIAMRDFITKVETLERESQPRVDFGSEITLQDRPY